MGELLPILFACPLHSQTLHAKIDYRNSSSLAEDAFFVQKITNSVEKIMRLKSLKLSGFKSFVDPTTIHFPSSLVAIVGPNGCGKSNTIDAIRWVLGESSAKNLRGDSMSDVIFNGSLSRKAVGQAAVELIFDNSDGKLQGEYGRFSEISVKRFVNRDGQSQYFLNGVKCRRRDITDLFLGTGLGPRSYAIIEQGMISRIIEAKPEELRVFLEDVAGIGKYKERRKETALRIQHTRDNLDRLNDIQEELGKQITHLERQAEAAEHFKKLKAEQRNLDAQLRGLRWKNLNQAYEKEQLKINETQTALEKHLLELQQHDTSLMTQRDEHEAANEIYQEVQNRFYHVSQEIARIEQSLKYQNERVRQLTTEEQQVQAQLVQTEQHVNVDQQKMIMLQEQHDRLTPQLAENEAHMEEAEQRLQEAQADADTLQIQWERINQHAAVTVRNVEVQQTKINHLDEATRKAQIRIAKLEEEKQTLFIDQLIKDKKLNEQSVQALEDEILQLQLDSDTAKQTLYQARTQLKQEQNALNHLREQAQKYRGRQASLEALQQAALGQQENKLGPWLAKHQLKDKPRLAQYLSVKEGWETAVETVLGDYLEAVCVEDIKAIAAFMEELKNTSVGLFEAADPQAYTQYEEERVSLQSKVTSSLNLSSYLGHIFCVDTLEQALNNRHQLKLHESLITPEGLWLGKNWLRICKPADAKAGVLAREKELKTLNHMLDGLEEQIITLSEKLEEDTILLDAHEAQRDTQDHSIRQLTRQKNDLDVKIATATSRIQSIEKRRTGIFQDIQELQQQITHDYQLSKQLRAQLQEAVEQMAVDSSAKESSEVERAQAQHRLNQAKTQLQQVQSQHQRFEIEAHRLETELKATQTNLERMQQHLTDAQTRLKNIQQEQHQLSEPLISQQLELEQKLETRWHEENALSNAKNRLDHLTQAMRQSEAARHQVEKQSNELRQHLENIKLNSHALLIRQKTLEETFEQSEQTIANILNELSSESTEKQLETQLKILETQIQALGAINLAALDEYKTQVERKTYLDAQIADLLEALATLEEAIQKIDEETRLRFKQTFDFVNNTLKDLFPRMFGGGEAYLELTSDDLIDTGVAIMARPPGKRNSTIHLLSGGEKALTAIALVFSLFKLNPAPFCLLDEVDAPLDDANVARFSRLVEEMSKEVQFIFITHNKVTMELAQQLMGVTMREPGVSRIVSVNVDEAAAMAVA